MKKILILSFALCFAFAGMAQQINTQLAVNVSKKVVDDDAFPAFFNVDFEQVITLRNAVSDTLQLSLENADPMNAIVRKFTFPKLQVFTKPSGNTDFKETPYLFDGERLTVVIPDKSSEIKIRYIFNPISHIKQMEAMYLLDYRYYADSWFFVCEKMEVASATIMVSDNIYFLSNLPCTREDDICRLNTSGLNDYNISLIFLMKEYYVKKSWRENTNAFDVYLSKDMGANADSTAPIAVDKDSLWTTSCMQSLQRIVLKMNGFIPNASLRANIIDGALSHEGIAWGFCIAPVQNAEYQVVIDTSFWRGDYIMHELLHAYLPHVPKDGDSARFLLGESIIEYLNVVLRQDAKNAAENFKKYEERCREKGIANASIFGLTENRTGDNSSSIIYEKTSVVLHKFAQHIGGDEKFLKILSQFYEQVQRTQQIDFQTFAAFLKSQGVSDNDWRWLVQNL